MRAMSSGNHEELNKEDVTAVAEVCLLAYITVPVKWRCVAAVM